MVRKITDEEITQIVDFQQVGEMRRGIGCFWWICGFLTLPLGGFGLLLCFLGWLFSQKAYHLIVKLESGEKVETWVTKDLLIEIKSKCF